MSEQPVSDSIQSNSIEVASVPSISRLLGVVPILPGESADLYQASLETLIEELGARSVLQVYLAEKIHECLWWMRRYEVQKRATVTTGMASELNSGYPPNSPANEAQIRNTLLANKVDNVIEEALNAQENTLESLRQVAMAGTNSELLQLDQQIALQTKILAGLQASYEVAFNRKTNAERLQLQNALIRRNLQSIEVEAEELSQA
ncbi:MAG: hypothetical protein HKK66_13605 [Chlorobiaceae bacterium]|nr:hypothetical protein [Chlorobiaceae bacterium]